VSKELRKRVLEALLKSQGFVSGAELARLLGVSRATVSRLVGELTEMGFVVEVRPGVGYRVEVLNDLRYAERVLATMRTRVRFSAHYLEKCSSSQDVAEALALQGASEGVVVVCEEMWGGRGRMGRKVVCCTEEGSGSQCSSDPHSSKTSTYSLWQQGSL
jgi:BirA family biotin operon repressor/biotin-[acetyl-CoA-carboxylase] ligase